jgi:hypothetical protein
MPLHVHRLESRLLLGNPLGDAAARDLHVWVPAGYDGAPLPALLALTGFTGTGAMLFNVDPLGEDLGRRLERLIASGACPPCIVAAPDCFTRLGGSQYINSTAIGPWQDHLIKEVLPFVEKSYPVTRWGVFGKSSGGYGAMVLGLSHPDVFVALADHSGDAGFEHCYFPDFPDALSAWREAGGPAAWLEGFWADPNRRRAKHMRPLNALAMAAHYSPNPASPHLGIDFPFDLETGEFRPAVWERWREHDPVTLIPRRVGAVAKLRLIYVDCGTRDEHGLIWGARTVATKLRAAGAEPVYQEFDDGHMNVGYRYDCSLPPLVRAL